jgi:chromate transport protein ChrA
MAPTSTHADQHRHVFRGFDDAMTQLLGADLRLLYGMAVPILMIIGLIVLLALNPAKWVVAMVVVCEIAGLALIVRALYELMSDDDQDEVQRPS